MGQLDVYGVLRAAYGSIFRYPRVFLILAVPVCLFSTFIGFLQINGAHLSGWLLLLSFIGSLISIYLQLVLALVWHRTILLQQDQIEPLFYPSRRLAKFLKYAALYVLVLGVLSFLLATQEGLSGDPNHTMTGHEWFFLQSSAAFLVLTALVVARFGFVFPASSIDQPTSLKIAWQQTVGMALPLTMLLFLAQVPFTALTLAFHYGAQLAGSNWTSVLLRGLGSLIGYCGFLVLIAAVSQVYAWRQNIRSEAVSAAS